MIKTITAISILFFISTTLDASSFDSEDYLPNDVITQTINNQMPYIVYGFKSLGFSHNRVNNECKIIHESIFYKNTLTPEQKMYVYKKCMGIAERFYGRN